MRIATPVVNACVAVGPLCLQAHKQSGLDTGLSISVHLRWPAFSSLAHWHWAARPLAPVLRSSRIVWSLQAGVVFFTLGLWLVQNRVMEEIAAGFGVTGTIVMMVGVGFTTSAVVAYVVSVRLGLLSKEPS